MYRQRTPFLFKLLFASVLVVSVVLGIRLNTVQSQLQTIRTILNDTWDKANHRLMSTAWTGGAAANTTFETETTIYNDVWDQPNHLLRTSSGGGGGGGDFSSNTTTSVDGEVVVFSGTGGKFGRRPGTLNGYAFLTNGVLSTTSGAGLNDPGAVGYVVRSALNSTVARSILGTSGNVSVTNPTGAAGDSVIDLVSVVTPGSCTNCNLTIDAKGRVTTQSTGAGGGGSPLTIRELDGAPSIAGVTTLQVSNGTLVDNGGGVATLVTGGGGGGGSGTVSLGTPNAAARYNTTDTTVGPSTGLTLSPTKVLTTYNNVSTITANTTLDQQNMVNCLAGGNTVTATLPPTSTTTVGHYTIVKGDTTGICQVAISGSDTFNGGAGPIQLTKQYDAVVVDVWIASSPGVWWYTATKAQWGSVQLTIKGADLPSSNAAIIAVDEPRPKLVFNDVTSWCASWTFAMNPDYGVNPQIVYKYTMTSATSGSTKMDWSVWKTTAGQAELAQSPGYDTVNTCTDTAVNGTAGRMSQVTCPLVTADTMVANDEVTIKACRNVTGTAIGNLNMISAQLQYFKQ